jgi:hypothetical protein
MLAPSTIRKHTKAAAERMDITSPGRSDGSISSSSDPASDEIQVDPADGTHSSTEDADNLPIGADDIPPYHHDDAFDGNMDVYHSPALSQGSSNEDHEILRIRLGIQNNLDSDEEMESPKSDGDVENNLEELIAEDDNEDVDDQELRRLLELADDEEWERELDMLRMYPPYIHFLFTNISAFRCSNHNRT